MPGLLLHSPSEVVQSLIVASGWASDPDAGSAWPIFIASEPIEPDNCITVYDTAGMDDGIVMFSGELQEHYGIQVRVRAVDHITGYPAANALAVHLDSITAYTAVVVGGSRYRFTSWTRTSSVMALGKELTTSKRSLFTFNGVVTLRKL